jgi:hypothetical protein
MLPKRVQVVKRTKVEVSGSICLSPLTHGTPVRSASVSRTSPLTSGLPQQARVVESNSEYAIIEITCSCGSKSHIQCNYAHLTEGSSRP